MSIVTKKTFGTDSNKEVVFKPRNKTPASYRSITHIPDEILEDEDLNEAIKLLPSNYNFEIHKKR